MVSIQASCAAAERVQVASRAPLLLMVSAAAGELMLCASGMSTAPAAMSLPRATESVYCPEAKPLCCARYVPGVSASSVRLTAPEGVENCTLAAVAGAAVPVSASVTVNCVLKLPAGSASDTTLATTTSVPLFIAGAEGAAGLP